MKRYTITVVISALFVLLPNLMTGQQREAFLEQVFLNHPDIESYNELLEAYRIEGLTGNHPAPLRIGFGYYPGVPDEIGIKRTISASQAFEFPLSYIRRADLNRDLFELNSIEVESAILAILIEAKITAFDYIAASRRVELLREKEAGYSDLRSGWNRMLEEGKVTQFDYNRLMLELSRTRSEIDLLEASKESMMSDLNFYSGGNGHLLSGAGYPDYELPDLEMLLSEKRESHPEFILHRQEQITAQSDLQLARALNMPAIEIGFNSEMVAGKRHTGPSVGLSVPLWTNRNKVRFAEARLSAAGVHAEAATDRLAVRTESDYRYYSQLSESYDRLYGIYRESGSDQPALRAVSEQAITITEYISHMDARYSALETLVKLETEIMKLLVRLYDHRLLEKVIQSSVNR